MIYQLKQVYNVSRCPYSQIKKIPSITITTNRKQHDMIDSNSEMFKGRWSMMFRIIATTTKPSKRYKTKQPTWPKIESDTVAKNKDNKKTRDWLFT